MTLARLARPGLSPLVRRAGLPLRPALMPRRLSSSALRNDGFNEALPRGDVVAPIIFGSFFAGAWYMADEGRIKPMIEEIEPNTDPNAWPTPKQMFGHIWPFIASTLGMIFESVACKFTQTSDMKWLCTIAMNDDMKAAVALCLLVAPAEHSSAFVHAINEHGTLRRIKEVVQIYKTLPRDQHDDVMTNACVITAKVAAMPALRDDSLGADDFVWMMPEDKAPVACACAQGRQLPQPRHARRLRRTAASVTRPACGPRAATSHLPYPTSGHRLTGVSVHGVRHRRARAHVAGQPQSDAARGRRDAPRRARCRRAVELQEEGELGC